MDPINHGQKLLSLWTKINLPFKSFLSVLITVMKSWLTHILFFCYKGCIPQWKLCIAHAESQLQPYVIHKFWLVRPIMSI
jgi:hypothetical protein